MCVMSVTPIKGILMVLHDICDILVLCVMVVIVCLFCAPLANDTYICKHCVLRCVLCGDMCVCFIKFLSNVLGLMLQLHN